MSFRVRGYSAQNLKAADGGLTPSAPRLLQRDGGGAAAE
jgi:hypothetical protein